MQMSKAEIAGSFRRSDKKREQINILAELNDCDQEQIKKILIEEGMGEDIPKTPKKRRAAPKQGIPDPANDEEIPGAITGGEGDVEGYTPHNHRMIEKIAETGPMDGNEAERLKRHIAIPEPIKALCLAEVKRLTEEVMKLERERDEILDYLNGEDVC